MTTITRQDIAGYLEAADTALRNRFGITLDAIAPYGWRAAYRAGVTADRAATAAFWAHRAAESRAQDARAAR